MLGLWPQKWSLSWTDLVPTVSASYSGSSGSTKYQTPGSKSWLIWNRSSVSPERDSCDISAMSWDSKLTSPPESLLFIAPNTAAAREARQCSASTRTSPAYSPTPWSSWTLITSCTLLRIESIGGNLLPKLALFDLLSYFLSFLLCLLV